MRGRSRIVHKTPGSRDSSTTRRSRSAVGAVRLPISSVENVFGDKLKGYSTRDETSGSMYGVGDCTACSSWQNRVGEEGFTYTPECPRLGSMYGEAALYEMQRNCGYGSQMGMIACNAYSSMYDMGTMQGSTYGMGAMQGSMYSMGAMQGSMYGMGAMQGSTYGMGAMQGSMYSMGNYGHSSMDQPHVQLGRVVKLDVSCPYTFPSNLTAPGLRRHILSKVGTQYGSFYANANTPPNPIPREREEGWETEQQEQQQTDQLPRNEPEKQHKSRRQLQECETEQEQHIQQESEGSHEREELEEQLKEDGSRSQLKRDQRQRRTLTHTARNLAEAEGENEAPVSVSTKSASTDFSFCKENCIPVASPTNQAAEDPCRVRTLVIIEKDVAVDAAAIFTIAGNTVMLGQQKYTANEVMLHDPCSEEEEEVVKKSIALSNMINDLLSGHNSVLLVSSDGKATTASYALVLASLKQIVRRLHAQDMRRSREAVMTLAFSSLRRGKVRDLLSHKGGTGVAEPIKLAESPLLGTVILNTTTVEVNTVNDCERYVQTALQNESESSEELVVGTLLLKQWVKETGDVFISSFLVVLSRDGVRPFLNVRRKNGDASAVLLSCAINGPSVVVHGVCLAEINSICGDMLHHAEELGKVVSLPPYSGNVRRLLARAGKKAVYLKEKAQTGDEVAALQYHRIEVMLKDIRELLERPEATKVPLSSEVSDGAGRKVSSPLSDTAGAQGSGAGSKEAAAATAESGAGNSGEMIVSFSDLTKIKDRDYTKIAVAVLADRFNSRRVMRTGRSSVRVEGQEMNGVEFATLSEVTPKKVPFHCIKRLCDAFAHGTNVALLALDSPSAAPNLESPAWVAINQAVATALDRKSSNRGKSNDDTEEVCDLRASIVLISGAEVMDLVKVSGTMERLVVASSPLFGPLVATAELCAVPSVDAFGKMVAVARTSAVGKTSKKTFVVVTLVLHATHNGDSFVSSFFGCLAGQNTALYEDVLTKNAIEPHLKLCSNAVRGPVCSVLLLGLHSADNNKSLVEAQQAICAVEHPPVRSGSVRKYLEHNRAAIRSRREKLEKTNDSHEKAYLGLVVNQMERMLRDYAALLREPEKHFPQVYSTIFERSNWLIRRAVMVIVEEWDPCDASVVTPKSSSTSLTTKFDVAEAVALKPEGSVPTLYTLQAMRDNFAAMQNIAFLTANATNTPFAVDPVWIETRKVISGVLTDVGEGEKVALDLFSVIVHGDELLADLLMSPGSITAPVVLQTVLSPLVPPLPHPATRVYVTDPSKADDVIASVLRRAEAYREEINVKGATLIFGALQRRYKADGDVVLSLMSVVATGPDMQPYREVVEERSLTAVHVLLSGMLERPCMSVFVLTLKSGDTSCAEALLLQKKICASYNTPQTAHTVKEFIQYSKKFRDRLIESGGKKKERAKMEKLEVAAKDHAVLLEDFDAAVPLYLTMGIKYVQAPHHEGREDVKKKRSNSSIGSGSDSSRRKGNGVMPISRMVVVTTRRTDIDAITVDRDEKSLTVENAGGKSKRFLVDEVITRCSVAARIRSPLLDEVCGRFIAGYNSALLTSATTPFSAEITLVLRTVNRVFVSLPPNSELFLSLVSVRALKARDILVRGSAFEPYTIASSPLFGPMVHGAKLVRLHDAATLMKHLTSTIDLESAMCVVLLVLKQVVKQQDDVVISSLLMTQSGRDPTPYLEAAAAESSRDRGLVRHALGGACFTVGAVCLHTSGDGGAEWLLQALETMAAVRCKRPFHGSVQRFLDYTKGALRCFRAKLGLVDGMERASVERWVVTLETMARDAMKMLDSPEGVIPPVYLTS